MVNFATGHCDFVVLAADIARWVGDEGLDEGAEVVVARGATELSHGEHMYAQNKTCTHGVTNHSHTAPEGVPRKCTKSEGFYGKCRLAFCVVLRGEAFRSKKSKPRFPSPPPPPICCGGAIRQPATSLRLLPDPFVASSIPSPPPRGARTAG